MAIEMEIKAWARAPEAVRGRLEKTSVFKGTFEKKDAYWAAEARQDSPSRPLWVRVRKESFTETESLKEAGKPRSRVLVTYKEKEVKDGMEINDEKEFSVEGSAEFEEFLCFQGYTMRREKRKRGFSYSYGEINAELTEIEGLGWFAELEITSPAREEKSVKAARDKLFSFLDEIGIDRKDVESRFYSEMLEKNLCERAR